MKKILLLCFLPILLHSQSQYRFFINNINMPMDNRGVFADVYQIPGGQGAKYNDIPFLFSGGFWLSGYDADTLWANGSATVAYLENFIPGNVDSNQYDPRYDIYVVENSGLINYTDWNRYKFAVNNGADYYDGDGNGIYDPIDLNNNYRWDPNEDKPDVLSIGSQTAWCIYNDGEDYRIFFAGVEPFGIEIHQSVFGFYNYFAPQLQNVVFIRYKIINTGKVNALLDSVYFTAWADADLGINSEDDLVGSDTLLNSGFIYNKLATDSEFGSENLSFFITLLQGPQSYIPGETFIDNNSNGIYDEGVDSPIDTAYNRKGNELGVELFPGAKNLNMTSFTHYISSDPVNGGPSNELEARNYMNGLMPDGQIINPCSWYYGEVRGGINCEEVNPMYWCSGDPVTDIGWINTLASDQRMVVNTGAFNLEVGKPITIIAAYIIGEGIDRLDGITKAREIAEFTQQFYQSNFDDNLVSVDEVNVTLPTDFMLYQNYRNPFNPSTKISWHSPVGSWQTLKVFDVLGNEVATLVTEEKPAGNYEVNFVASSLSSGVYFYQLKAGAFLETKKLILLR